MSRWERHQPSGKLFHWRYCVRCGLIYIDNPATKQAVKDGCDPKSVARRQKYSQRSRARA